MANNKTEQILIRAIELYEQGKPIPEILNLYPQQQEEIKEVLETADYLKSTREKVVPSREILNQILAQVSSDASVTKVQANRYLYRGGEKGRPSIIQLFDVINLANMTKAIYIGLGVLLAILIVGGIYWQSQKGGLVTVTPTTGPTANTGATPSGTPGGTQVTPTPNIQPIVDTTSMDNLEQELALVTDGYSTDANDLNTINSDTSFSNLDSELTSITEI